ncbi:MAG: PQQ-binding-like beta-propeller repeat protein, partial [Bryobacterales bacterium]|nr:PQQ-binding-like beta-propeller repeat protein [Bryobacterales bacterium]
MVWLKKHGNIAVAASALAVLTIGFTEIGAQELGGSGASVLTRSAPQASNVDAKALNNAGTAQDTLLGDWLSYGRTLNEKRYSPLNQIDTSNVNRLGLSWTYTLGPGGGNQEATPLVWNNTIYGITNWSVVFALDARSHKEIWRWDPEVNQPAVRPKICCGIVNRGLAIYNGMIFAPVIDGRLEALNASTGKVIWEARVAYTQEWHSITMAP